MSLNHSVWFEKMENTAFFQFLDVLEQSKTSLRLCRQGNEKNDSPLHRGLTDIEVFAIV